MHPNPAFHTATDDRNLAFARERAFGVLAVTGTDGPTLAHIPFLLDDDGRTAWLHLVRSNPIARGPDGLKATLAVSGPDAYVSPDWYGVADQVPTWNYVAVHLGGRLERQPDHIMRDLLDRQSALFETRLAPKHPWTTGKMTPEVLARMMRQIVPFALRIDSVAGTWKLNQNKADDVRLSAADHIEAQRLGTETDVLAALMRGA